MPDLSIIIVSWNVKKYLKDCLESIKSQTKTVSYEVIVVDNHSTDQTVEMVKDQFPEVKLIANQQNFGFAKANNQGLRLAVGQYLLLLNPDTKIIDQALDKIVELMNHQPQVGLAGCQLINADGSLQPSVRRFPRFIDHLLMTLKLHHLLPMRHYLAKDFDYQQSAVVDQLMGAFIMIRREAWQLIGLLDEKYHLWLEEVDFCLRAKRLGLVTVYSPTAKIIHYGGQSFKQAASVEKQWNFCLSRLHYLRKYGNLFELIIISILTPISLILTSLAGIFEKND